MGLHMETIAIAWLMKELTESPYYLGLLAVCKVAPLIPFAIVGGAVTDKVDRRRLLIVCLVGEGLISVSLFVLAHSGAIVPWHLLFAAALSSVLTGFNHPSRAAIIPNLTPKNEWMNAIALDTVSVRTAFIIVAPISGYLISWYGTSILFGTRAIGMTVAVWWLLMAEIPLNVISSKQKGIFHNLGNGLKFAFANSLIISLVLVFALREFQVETTNVFLPFFADDILRSGASGYGYLNLAQNLGGVCGLFGIITLGNFKYKGWLIICAGLATGLFISIFSISQWLILSFILLLTFSGLGTVFENVSRVALQSIIPDEMRGRIMSLREVMRGIFGSLASYGLGLGGEYFGILIVSLLFGIFIIGFVLTLAIFFPSFRNL